MQETSKPGFVRIQPFFPRQWSHAGWFGLGFILFPAISLLICAFLFGVRELMFHESSGAGTMIWSCVFGLVIGYLLVFKLDDTYYQYSEDVFAGPGFHWYGPRHYLVKGYGAIWLLMLGALFALAAYSWILYPLFIGAKSLLGR